MYRQIIQLNVRKSAWQEDQFAVESSGHLLCGTVLRVYHMEEVLDGVKESQVGKQCSSPAFFLGHAPPLPPAPASGGCFMGLEHVRLPEAVWSSPGRFRIFSVTWGKILNSLMPT